MKYVPAKPTPSYEEMEAYERGYNMATEDKTAPKLYEDKVLQSAFGCGWEDKLTSNLGKEVMPHTQGVESED